MKLIFQLLFLIAFTPEPFALAAQATDQARADTLRRIVMGDAEAIVAAGNSGEREYVPALRRVASRGRYDPNGDDTPVRRAHIALGRLGDTGELQILFCGALQVSAEPPIESLRAIGGWFTIRAMLAILDGVGAPEFQRGVIQAKVTDLSSPSPRFVALEVLTDVVANPPVPRSTLSPDKLDWHVAAWKDWIVLNAPELRKLTPTGDGVDFSYGACKNGQPAKRGSR